MEYKLTEDGYAGFSKDQMFVHFTSFEDARLIVKTKKLLPCSYMMAIFAVSAEGDGVFVPSVQTTGNEGRAKNRNFAVLFNTDYLCDWVYGEEAVWSIKRGMWDPNEGNSIGELEYLPLREAVIVTAGEAISLLQSRK